MHNSSKNVINVIYNTCAFDEAIFFLRLID